MPRQPRGFPSYRLHKPTGQAVVTIDGRDRYLGKFGTEESKARYTALIQDMMLARSRVEAKADAERRALRLDRTVNELIIRYLDYCQSYYRKDGRITSQVGMIRSALRVLRETHGPKTASSFGPLALKACQSDLVAKGLTRPGVNKRILLIRQFFRWASANEFIPPEIYHGLKSVDALRKDRTTAPEPEPIGPISDAAVEAVMPHVGPEVAAMVRLQLWSGMRPQEVCGMRPRDLTMVGDVWECRPRHKNEHHGKSRVVMFGPKCQELIKRFLGPDLDAPIFGRLTSSYRRAIHRGCDRAGIPRWSPNRLRHACGTNVRREFGLEAGRVVLGHAKVETTEIYAERDQDKAREIMRRMG